MEPRRPAPVKPDKRSQDDWGRLSDSDFSAKEKEYRAELRNGNLFAGKLWW